MTRLLVHVEGITEEDFVNNVLRDHLVGRGFGRVDARLVGNARQRSSRGGIKPWPSTKSDILRHLLEDAAAISTTMVDYYALPATGVKAWPGRAAATHLEAANKAPFVEQAIHAEIAEELGGAYYAKRFVPFVVMHEFEGLLFSDCAAFARSVARPALAPALQAIRNQFATPEEINDSPLTAPSKRVEELMPDYNKPLFGVLAAMEIGLDAIRNSCPHFHGWLSRLEALA